MGEPTKTVCFFGIYDPSYARNRILKEGFERNGYRVVECRVDPATYRGLSKYVRLYSEFRKIKFQHFDHILVCFPGHSVVPLARILFGKRIIFDAFVSLYDSAVFDRRVYSPWSVGALYSWLLDWSSCRIASCVLLDTNTHIRYFEETFGVPARKCIRVWVGADDTIFFPQPGAQDPTFTVHFHGTFIPVQGIEYIIEAAALLRTEDIHFRIIGNGQTAANIKSRIKQHQLSNVEMIGKVSALEVSHHMARAHVVLGIFGTTQKAQRVIPNKVYEAMAMGKAIITADTPGIRELPGSESALRLVPAGDARTLADAILDLKHHPETCRFLGDASAVLFRKQCTPERIVRELLDALKTQSFKFFR